MEEGRRNFIGTFRMSRKGITGRETRVGLRTNPLPSIQKGRGSEKLFFFTEGEGVWTFAGWLPSTRVRKKKRTAVTRVLGNKDVRGGGGRLRAAGEVQRGLAIN